MGLIFGNLHVKTHFLSQWSTKYVPAILSYGEKSAKKSVARQLTDMDEAGRIYLTCPTH